MPLVYSLPKSLQSILITNQVDGKLFFDSFPPDQLDMLINQYELFV